MSKTNKMADSPLAQIHEKSFDSKKLISSNSLTKSFAVGTGLAESQ